MQVELHRIVHVFSNQVEGHPFGQASRECVLAERYIIHENTFFHCLRQKAKIDWNVMHSEAALCHVLNCMYCL